MPSYSSWWQRYSASGSLCDVAPLADLMWQLLGCSRIPRLAISLPHLLSAAVIYRYPLPKRFKTSFAHPIRYFLFTYVDLQPIKLLLHPLIFTPIFTFIYDNYCDCELWLWLWTLNPLFWSTPPFATFNLYLLRYLFSPAGLVLTNPCQHATFTYLPMLPTCHLYFSKMEFQSSLPHNRIPWQFVYITMSVYINHDYIMSITIIVKNIPLFSILI